MLRAGSAINAIVDHDARRRSPGTARARRLIAGLALAAVSLIASQAPLAAQSVIKLGSTSAGTTASAKTETGCDTADYHAALSAIRAGEYAAIANARNEAGKPDARLPGRLLFNPIMAPKTREARQALMAANKLARSKNRPSWMASSDSRWIIKEVSNELGRYLAQDETPYLCYGVPDYLKTMRSYLARAGGDAASLDALKTVQAAIASNKINAALEEMRPVPLPKPAPEKPDDSLMAAGELRPAMGLSQTDAVTAPADKPQGASDGTSPSSDDAAMSSNGNGPAPVVNADLPPLTAPEPIKLSSDADRLAALDQVMEAARQSGALFGETSDRAPNQTAALSTPGAVTATDETADPRPVLDELAALRPLVYGARPAITDISVRRRLIDTFSAIEVLDYLDHRPAEYETSVPAAIGRTLDAISSANEKTCGCASN
ncbi:hypothetical protein [Jiella mangrovi]|uniref:Uncharacterized protein n=1 Tax=Jiella mangrovi TaxID=2821407 RepID=A0ABS4BDS5_9HYPH|nr:hypothetical protein [Jiella mangrovi]MBP0614903.1 hypothetical protein [Jiella mangrovi]